MSLEMGQQRRKALVRRWTWRKQRHDSRRKWRLSRKPPRTQSHHWATMPAGSSSSRLLTCYFLIHSHPPSQIPKVATWGLWPPFLAPGQQWVLEGMVSRRILQKLLKYIELCFKSHFPQKLCDFVFSHLGLLSRRGVLLAPISKDRKEHSVLGLATLKIIKDLSIYETNKIPFKRKSVSWA